MGLNAVSASRKAVYEDEMGPAAVSSSGKAVCEDEMGLVAVSSSGKAVCEDEMGCRWGRSVPESVEWSVPELVEGPTAARHSGPAFASFRACPPSFRARPGISPVKVQNTLVSHILSRFWPKKVQIRPFYTYFAHLDRKMCETPGFCTFFRLLRHPAAHLMSKNAHPCSRNHRFPHLVSKTAPARSRPRRSPSRR